MSAMNSGMLMMLKSFGIDPDKIMGEASKIGVMLANFQKQLDTLQAQNDMIVRLLSDLLATRAPTVEVPNGTQQSEERRNGIDGGGNARTD